MLRKIMAAIAAAIKFVAKVVWVPMKAAGRVALMPLTVLEKVFGGGGGGSPEAEAADQAAQQARQTAQQAERTMTAGDYSANLRNLARRRAEGREIDPALWQRLPGPLAEYVRSLTLPECEVIQKTELKMIGEFLEGRAVIDGVRTPTEIAENLEKASRGNADISAAAKPARDLHPEHAAISGEFQSSMAATIARARGNACASPGNARIPSVGNEVISAGKVAAAEDVQARVI